MQKKEKKKGRTYFFCLAQYIHLHLLAYPQHWNNYTGWETVCLLRVSDINLWWLQTADGLVTRYEWLLAARTQPQQQGSRTLVCLENSASPQPCPRGLCRVLDYDTARTNIKPVVQKGHQHAHGLSPSEGLRPVHGPPRHVQGFQTAERCVHSEETDWAH